ncbi:MAG TPA: hypothetical protein VIQ00_15905 [Chitinophagaceae bacterium]|nr:hypothetical protein [Hanamia sp.]
MSGECLLITETGRADDGTLGYGTFPADFATDPNVDGVVIETTAMGRIGNVARII